MQRLTCRMTAGLAPGLALAALLSRQPRARRRYWALPPLGDDAMDALAGPLDAIFDFKAPPRTDLLILDPSTGAPSDARR